MVINGQNVEYIRADCAAEKIEFTGEKTCAAWMIGKKVLVRSINEGINSGIVIYADNTGVILRHARRLHHHAPADKSLAWYGGVAISGISGDSRDWYCSERQRNDTY